MLNDQAPVILADLKRYLKFHGWSEGDQGWAGSLWTRGTARVGVPAEQDDDLVWGVIERLARLAGETPKATAEGIKNLQYDVTHLRVANHRAITDKIPLETATRLINSARYMLRATATTAGFEKSQIGGNYLRRGDQVVHDSFMGHTEYGSFIIPIMVPIPEIDQPDVHPAVDLFQETGSHVAPPEPFARRVVRTFVQSMQAMQDIVVTPGRPPTVDQLHELVYLGVSREFCNGLADVLSENTVAEFETRTEWSPTLPTPKSLSQKISIDAEAVSLVEDVSNRLRHERASTRQVFSGTIVELRHDHVDDPFGFITISTIRRGHQSRIQVRLPLRQYRDAWAWHSAGRAILVEGEIESIGRRPTVENPYRCHPLDDLFLDSDGS